MGMMQGKPTYDVTLLRHVTIGELKERIGRISNPQARHIAAHSRQHFGQSFDESLPSICDAHERHSAMQELQASMQDW